MTDKLTTGSGWIGWRGCAIGPSISRRCLLAFGRGSLFNGRGIQFIHFSGSDVLDGCGDEAEHHEGAGQCPCAFFQEVGRALYATDLLGSGETGRQAATFGILCKYDEGQKGTDDENNDGDGDHDYLFN